MKLGKEVGFGLRQIVLNGGPAPLPQRGMAPNFRPMCVVAKRSPISSTAEHLLLWPNGWMHQDVTWYGGRPQPRRLCGRWGPSTPSQKGAVPPVFSPRLLWPNGCMDQDAAWYGGRRRPTRHCVRWDPAPPSLKGHSPPVFGQCPLWLNG